MTGGIYDILGEQGATLTLQFEYQDESGNAVNITSNTNVIEFLLKKTSIKTDDFMFLIRSDGVEEEGSISYPRTDPTFGSITKTGGTVGSFLLTINSDTMNELSLGNYFYSLRLISGLTVTPLCKGRLTVESAVK